MSDLPAVSAGESVEAKAPPAPTISEISAGQPTSQAVDANAIEELSRKFQELRESLPILVERGIQSTKDRRFEAVLKAADEVAVVKKYLEAAGGDAEKAAREMWIDAQMSGKPQPPVPGRTEVDDFDERYAGILAKRGIAPDDVELDGWVKSHKFGSKNAFLDEVRDEAERMKNRREKQGKAGSPAAVVTEAQGGAPVPPGDVDDLTHRLNRAIASGNTAAIAKADEALREAIARGR